jgi:CMP-N,N'-diacetyllegionaminic acid synthase
MKGRVIVVIPARGGSKRFPRKNIATLVDRPLLAYSIAASLESIMVDDVYVSTEDIEISKVAMKYGAQVPFLRPLHLSGDEITADVAVADMVNRLQVEKNISADIVVLIQPTSAFVTSAHIDTAVKLLHENADIDSVTTMCELDHRHHPYNLAFPSKGEDRWGFMFEKERNEAHSRQSKPTALKFGNLFAVRVETMLNVGRFGINKGFVLIDQLYSWDVDYSWELDIAEFLIKNRIVNLPHIK